MRIHCGSVGVIVKVHRVAFVAYDQYENVESSYAMRHFNVAGFAVCGRHLFVVFVQRECGEPRICWDKIREFVRDTFYYYTFNSLLGVSGFIISWIVDKTEIKKIVTKNILKEKSEIFVIEYRNELKFKLT